MRAHDLDFVHDLLCGTRKGVKKAHDQSGFHTFFVTFQKHEGRGCGCLHPTQLTRPTTRSVDDDFHVHFHSVREIMPP